MSIYVQQIINLGGLSAGAVQCGLRPQEWGITLHNMIESLLETHAGDPMPNIAPDGTLAYTAHVPSDAEKNAALADLTRAEKDGVYQASQPYAKAGGPLSYCTIVQNMTLTELDNFESGASSMWPAMDQ